MGYTFYKVSSKQSTFLPSHFQVLHESDLDKLVERIRKHVVVTPSAPVFKVDLEYGQKVRRDHNNNLVIDDILITHRKVYIEYIRQQYIQCTITGNAYVRTEERIVHKSLEIDGVPYYGQYLEKVDSSWEKVEVKSIVNIDIVDIQLWSDEDSGHLAE